jgi:hypothetical protein
MKAALIPPKGYLYTTRKADYHLCLAQIAEPAYRDFYRNHIHRSAFLIVDNGAAEGDPVDSDELARVALEYGADEIVIPDVMRDAKRTLQALDDFIENGYPDRLPSMSYMFVAQGTYVLEVIECIASALKRMPLTIGIPRHLLETFDRVDARVDILKRFQDEFGTEIPVHLLGTSYLMPGEVLQVAQKFPWVRGVDTSMPYNHAMASCDLRDRMSVTRPRNYFTEIHYMSDDLLNRNIETYQGWANGTEGARS